MNENKFDDKKWIQVSQKKWHNSLELAIQMSNLDQKLIHVSKKIKASSVCYCREA